MQIKLLATLVTLLCTGTYYYDFIFVMALLVGIKHGAFWV